ncbi:winged helix-turn-helix transcriptional regulator [Murinocardiopsis flavida]|nr:helix-turn-helix domain-containing protein [Murinocardiopsis flavida]
MPEWCTVEVAMSVLGGKWKMLIVKYLLDGACRFGALQRALPGITHRMLSRQLRELEADGIVARRAYAQVPPKVEYSLTPIGAQLCGVSSALEEWGGRYRRAASAAAPAAGRAAGGAPEPGGTSGD